jgi:hypothetical protein
MAELRIPIVVENKGKKAFSDTSKSVSALDNNVKKLGKSLAAVFGAQQLLKFTKNAASAFIEDQREATRLAMAVKNLGLAFEAPAIEDYIQKLSRLSGVTDSQLRPSMQALLQITGSVTESQKILNQALDVAAATGIDVSTVAQDIGRAYTGNTRGLRKYNLGLTQAELTTSSYVDVQARLNTLFGGANAAQLQTYAGQMSLLTVATSEASETIGKGLIDALITVSDSKDVTDFVNKIDSIAQRISNAIGSVSRFIQVIKLLPSATGSDDPRFKAIFDPARNAQPLTSTNVLGISTLQKQEAQRKKVESDAMRRAKELLSVQKKNLDAQKKQLTLTKASKTLNLEAIGIEAALKGQISETDRLSLLLQKSILEGNASLATQLSDQLEAAIKRQNEIRQLLLTTPKAPNPYADWKIPDNLMAYTAASLGVSQETIISAPQTIVATSDATQEMIDALVAAAEAQRKADAAQAAADAAAANVIVKVEVAGEDVAAIITQQQVNDSLSGTFASTSRFGAKGAIAL